MLLIAAGLGLLFTGYWFYVISVNVQFTSGQTTWFYLDAWVRIVLCVVLAAAAILVLAGRRAGGVMLLPWSIAYLLWIPASAMGAMRAGEPSPDMVLAVLIYGLLGGSPLAIGLGLIVPLCIWFIPPALACAAGIRPQPRGQAGPATSAGLKQD